MPIRHARTRWARSVGASRAAEPVCGFGAPVQGHGAPVDRVDRIGKTDLVQPARAPAP